MIDLYIAEALQATKDLVFSEDKELLEVYSCYNKQNGMVVFFAKSNGF